MMDVTPDKQNLDMVFANTTYYIDFYQRQYKWTEVPVKRLLDDIFYKFNIEYSRLKDNDIELDKLVEKYSWYYLSTYVTNIVEGKLFVVDGQQRLTTLSLILIKLRHLADSYQSELKDWITAKIAGQAGFRKEFWMNHEQHKTAMQHLFDNDSDLDSIKTSTGITAVNMLQNYKIISNYLNRELSEKHKFESFVFYFLKRLVLINLNVEQTDVPMVFEVINDRGVRLKSYEILKGKLLGEIDKEELEKLGLNDLWEDQVSAVNSFKEDEIDNFFIYYLRAKYANTVGEARNYDRDYHRMIFTPELDEELGLLHNPKRVKQFLQNEFRYFTDLYGKIYEYSLNQNADYMHVYYNRLNEMDSQFLLVLSACTINDTEESEKIKTVSYQVDRLFSLLQLQRSYDSNDFNVAIYQISSEIRNKPVKEIPATFNKYLLSLLSAARGVKTSEVYSYGLFKDTGIELSKRYKRYFFARIEEFIAQNTKLNIKHSLYDLVSNTGAVKGFHIEHILAENDENKKLFDNDDDVFERERNRLGGLLLLKGKDNISSNNESYQYKLKSYANTLYWNESLRSDSYKSKLDFSDMIKKYNLKFRPMNTFGPDELEERHKLLFAMAKYIWA
jgi:uncharacterized protein with ParB-like and HNH nuclease domain